MTSQAVISRETLIIGIDPGIKGGIAAAGTYFPKGRVEPMPIGKTKSGRDTYELAGIVRALRAYLIYRPIAFLEKGQPLPSLPGRGVAGQGGSIANYHRGLGRGIFEGILTALGIPYDLVTPQQWQNEMLPMKGGDTKARSITAAKKLFPEVSLFATARSRKPSDGLSDALLLAAYGMRRQLP